MTERRSRLAPTGIDKTLCVAALLALVGCGPDGLPKTPAPPIPSVTFSAELKQVSLPTSTHKATPVEATARVLISDHYLLIDGDTYPIARFEGLAALARAGLDQRHKRSGSDDLIISSLAHGLSWTRAQSEHPDKAVLVLLADRATPYRVLYEILYTAHDSDYAELSIAVRAQSKQASVSLSLAEGQPFDETEMTVMVGADGFTVQTTAGTLAHSCQRIGEGVTLPKLGDRHDFAGLTECATHLKADAALSSLKRVTVRSAPDTELQIVVATMDALRGDAAELFPAVILGASP